MIIVDNNHWVCIVVYTEEKRIQYYDSLKFFGKVDIYLKGTLRYLYDLDEKKEHIKPDKWMLVHCAETVPQQKNRVDCGASVYMYCYYISHDSCLDFDESIITKFQKMIAISILNGKGAGDRSDVNQSFQVHTLAAGTSEYIDIRDVPKGSPQVCQVQAHHKIISGTTFENELYAAKLHNKLPKNIRRLLQEYANKYLTKPDEDIHFKYYQTRSNEITEPEMNASSICKGLLARLNPRDKTPQKTFPCNELVPYSAKRISSHKSKIEIIAPTKYIVEIPVAYIIVPLFDGNNDSVTLELKPGGKKSKQVSYQLKKGNAYIVHCKNHVDKKSKTCRHNSVNCALHCYRHILIANNSLQL